ncbi:kinesin-like protein KIF26A isoform X4 [Tachysurus ichikawai]
MDVKKSEDASGSDKTNPTLIDLGTFFVDSDIIFGFTSHLLRRKAKVDGISSAESSSCSSSEPSPRQRRYGSRPQPEGARSVSITETDRDDVTKATDLCKQCQVTVAELKRQALALTEPTSLQHGNLKSSGLPDHADHCSCVVCTRFGDGGRRLEQRIITLSDSVLMA